MTIALERHKAQDGWAYFKGAKEVALVSRSQFSGSSIVWVALFYRGHGMAESRVFQTYEEADDWVRSKAK